MIKFICGIIFIALMLFPLTVFCWFVFLYADRPEQFLSTNKIFSELCFIWIDRSASCRQVYVNAIDEHLRIFIWKIDKARLKRFCSYRCICVSEKRMSWSSSTLVKHVLHSFALIPLIYAFCTDTKDLSFGLSEIKLS